MTNDAENQFIAQAAHDAAHFVEVAAALDDEMNDADCEAIIASMRIAAASMRRALAIVDEIERTREAAKAEASRMANRCTIIRHGLTCGARLLMNGDCPLCVAATTRY